MASSTWIAGNSSKYPGFAASEIASFIAVPLSSRDQAVLDFERSWWLIPGPKDRAIKDHLDMSATQYYRILRRLREDPEAAIYDPLTVRRLQRSTKTKRVEILNAEGDEG